MNLWLLFLELNLKQNRFFRKFPFIFCLFIPIVKNNIVHFLLMIPQSTN